MEDGLPDCTFHDFRRCVARYRRRVRPIKNLDGNTQYAEVNGVRLHYVTAGKGPLIIFLHGFPEFWYEWKDQLPEFGKDHRAVAPDMRGYNLSDKPAGVDRYQMKDLVEDVRALAEHLGYKKFVLVGHDWGGGVAWSFRDRASRISRKAGHRQLSASRDPRARTRRKSRRSRRPASTCCCSAARRPSRRCRPTIMRLWWTAVLGDGLKTGVFTEADKQAYIKRGRSPALSPAD